MYNCTYVLYIHIHIYIKRVREYTPMYTCGLLWTRESFYVYLCLCVYMCVLSVSALYNLSKVNMDCLGNID